MSEAPLSRAPVGLVPIIWNNADLTDLAPLVPADTVLDEIARLGYAGCQFGRGFPEGHELAEALERRGLRLAERYLALPTDALGPRPEARDLGMRTLKALVEAGGEVLVVALEGHPERDAWSGRVASGAPGLTDAGLRRLVELVNELGAAAAAAGVRCTFHPHTGTWVESPPEAMRLAAETDHRSVGICLDVGHWLVGGGDPVAALREFGERVTHVHLKDVDAAVLDRLHRGELGGFRAAVRERIFTELGNGILDLAAVLAELARRDFDGWLMIEQDTSWLPPAEAAAVGLRVYEYARRQLAGSVGVAS